MNKNGEAVATYLAALGAFITCWAKLEVSLNHWLALLLKADAKYANMFVSTLPARVKIERAELLAIAHFPTEETKIKSLFGRLDKLREKRNDYIHCVWQTFEIHESGKHVANTIAPRQSKATDVLESKPLKLEDLQKDGRDVTQALEETKEFFKSVGLLT